MISVSQLIKFVLDNRHGRAFFEYNQEQIAHDIVSGVNKLACIVDCDEQENIFGIATGLPDYKNRIMHVKNILTVRRSSMKAILQRFTKIYPGWTLTGYRRGKLIHYNNINKLLEKTYG